MHSEKGLSISVVLGYNASKWLAFALNRGRVRAYHERLYKIAGLGSWVKTFDYLLHNPIAGGPMRKYWKAVRKDINSGYDVVDTNIWPAYHVQKVNEHFPLKHILYVTRNGIRWVYSVLKSSSFRNKRTKSFSLDTYLRVYWNILGKPGKPWQNRSKFERICFYWSTSYSMANWLEEQGFTIHRHTMEGLTNGQEIHTLYELFGLKVDNKEIVKIQRNNINNHTEYITAKEAWDSWTPIYQDQFMETCGEGMDYYGYEVF